MHERHSVAAKASAPDPRSKAKSKNVLDAVDREPQHLGLPDVPQLVLALLRDRLAHARLPPEELDHAQDAEHYKAAVSARIIFDVESDNILSVTVCTRASVFFIAVS